MGHIEVDEEKLRRFVNASLFTCMDLNYHLFKYKSCIIRCQNCPLTTVESCKKANRDFFILAVAYVATLMLMIYLFIG